MTRKAFLALVVVAMAALCACAEVDVYIGGAGSGDIEVETHAYAWGGESHDYFEATNSTYVFAKNVHLWETDSGTGALVRRFDEALHIDAAGSFYYEGSTWSMDGRHGHYELGAYASFGGVGELEFERISHVGYKYYISDGWLTQEINVEGFLEQGFVSVAHMADAIQDSAAQLYEFHIWAGSGEDHIFQAAHVDPGETVHFGVSVDFLEESFGIHSVIDDYGW